ncbi:hypothetical protein G3I44_14110 [Halogeometricum borinquense]|uniref:Uncharacterized protein n=1 Tax=Halogeometricum borinquense TaxID=60847 RepID=A0A6C0ULT3_9EURY|nr:hypothetical protein [Halogeometricum borinquense]QIB75321.1 hypothetical protein G3I44_14110 [Halogeometricum borinquense]
MTQATLGREDCTVYVYECPRCGDRCWDSENLEEREGSAWYFCDCSPRDDEEFVMQLAGEFSFNRFTDMEEDLIRREYEAVGAPRQALG